MRSKLVNRFQYRAISTNGTTTSPNPTLPPFDFTPQKYQGPSYDTVSQNRNSHLCPGIFKYYKKPIMLTEGRMQYLFDESGKKYLDFLGGIVTVSVGHCHPKIVEAGVQQMKTLMHSTTAYLHPGISMYAKELADKMPGDLKVCYFVNSGSEANDLAVLLARLYTGNSDILAIRNAYHGMSYTTMGLTALHTWKFPAVHGQGVHHVLCPDLYKGLFQRDDPEAVDKYVWDIQNLINSSTPGKIAGFIAEAIQGAGGFVELPDGYLKQAYEIVRKAGGVCIADEVQTGFGRLGTHYWGFQNQGVMPDIVTMAKGIGNGVPLAAVVTTPKIASTLTQRLHFNTFGGNPVSMAIGRAVLKVIDEEGLQKRTLELGKRLKDGLEVLKKKHEVIGDVRGKGLMVAIELVKDKKSKMPLPPEEVANYFEKTKDLGLLVGKGGLTGNVFRMAPPMCISAEDVDFALHVFDKTFSA